jgi:hypothetical protein
VRFSQEPVTEKIQGLNTVGDAAGQQTLVKSVFAMGWEWNVTIHMLG